MIAILFTARNGPNPVPQDARAHSLCRAEGVMVTQYRIGANAFRFAASSRPLDSSGETERSRGVCPIDTVPMASAVVRGPEMRLSTFLVSAAEFERASRCCDLQNPR